MIACVSEGIFNKLLLLCFLVAYNQANQIQYIFFFLLLVNFD